MKRLLPAYPIWVIDPMFSVWSPSETLNGGDTIFWTGKIRKTYGLVRYDGKTYTFMGQLPGTDALKQEDVSVSAYATDYVFSCEKFVLRVSFVSPLTPKNLEVLSCPVCYTEYEIIPNNGIMAQDLSVALVLDEGYCYEEADRVTGGVIPMNGYEAAYFSRRRNLVMSNANDCVAPDWGDIYIAGGEAWYIPSSALDRFVQSGVAEYIHINNERHYIMAVEKSAKGYFMTAFDDRIAIFYFGDWLKDYFFKDGRTVLDALDFSRQKHDAILCDLAAFDKEFKKDCDAIGKDYYLLACAAYRQSIGAHKLVENKKGEILFLSKECNSNGCIGTADVSYPSIPLFLLYNPELVKGMLRGIFEFARMPVWKFDFAPHDIGTYPYCCGQVYGINRSQDKYNCGNTAGWGDGMLTHPMLYQRPAACDIYDFNYQMPVEECGNMIIMTAAACVASKEYAIAEENFDLLEKWVVYLEKYGLKPENQLCTDDFAGHLANNINLAIKAIVGIESFGILCEKTGRGDAEKYYALAADYAKRLKEMAGDGVMPLAYGQKGTYSLKYNMLFDKLFGFNLFENSLCEQEVAYYIEQNNRYGVPLDTRADYTKSDWILWCTCLTADPQKAETLYAPIVTYLSESPTHLPFSDWYGTQDGKCVHFFNRTVQGGILAPILKKSEILKIK